MEKVHKDKKMVAVPLLGLQPKDYKAVQDNYEIQVVTPFGLIARSGEGWHQVEELLNDYMRRADCPPELEHLLNTDMR